VEGETKVMKKKEQERWRSFDLEEYEK